MAIVNVPMTHESLAHLHRIMDKVVDPKEPDHVHKSFKHIVSCLHYMCAGVQGKWDAKNRTFKMATPTAAQEAVKKGLDDMMKTSSQSMTTANKQEAGKVFCN